LAVKTPAARDGTVIEIGVAPNPTLFTFVKPAVIAAGLNTILYSFGLPVVPVYGSKAVVVPVQIGAIGKLKLIVAPTWILIG